MTQNHEGALYVVATPIGNLEDISARALRLLGEADLIAAEDTRHSARLLDHFGIRGPLMSLHEHNEASRIDTMVARIEQGQNIALISDAGTPLISDPGYRLVQALRERGSRVVPVPGPCALVTALSAAGLPSQPFTFRGFVSAKAQARLEELERSVRSVGTQIFYESPHRIRAFLEALESLVPERRVVLARELTKTFETFLDGTPPELLARIEEDPNQARGEFVVLVEGAPALEGQQEHVDIEAEALLEALQAEGVGVKQSAAIAARLLGGRKKQWYQRLLDKGNGV
ncbi:16S rRNA (cytidine(1402)-2'-O)-methyltransferase [Larsenimonas rhizosphaerae]|uniref:Ribosomal RNA small subunit methyltransferase I n=1 Tax=Larsenimonas rhizosphaerae TaxID=2944682 RepID=A0AA41ZH30_9GAMM|nr:16S rRNA (cytidine(1402)-2'-O)-methyltransferase [Larsenimonas rhizosphaerae]MCX2523758.1 16S rRNA (cytidine(1402)-2'-O)-methyltransferase [Larsenimonas rhizosphaerae]